ncbi:histidine kinase [Glycomyces luteolus]|uniref:histidine kinase n=1 Tax=Glycomyces luteolus TaxID=2670330 RepID=A0A9X3PCS5_9ACTN|nr:histidine kinase [Glycomyces luteolus]MDA1362823.1 histidine kinase [Glycomyces luteolus]
MKPDTKPTKKSRRNKAELAEPRPARILLSYLIAAGPVGNGTWRWRFATTLALFGPGSVPFGLMLAAIENQVLRADYGIAWAALPAAATGAAVILARFRPFEAWALVMASFAATLFGAFVENWEPWPLTTTNLFASLVVLFALGRDRRAWVGVAAWVSYFLAGAYTVWASNMGLFTPQPASAVLPSGSLASENLTLGTLLGAFAFLIGFTVRIWRQARKRVAEEEQVAEAERHQRRLLEERTRIARELHDIVAHHMSVITVQSSTAEYRLADLSEEAKAEFRSISDQARESLAEMRRLLGVLRSGDEAGARAPQPGPEALRGLAEAVDRAGTPVSLRLGGLPEDLPETVALTVFRVVQEALSNVVRHAPGARTGADVAAVGGQVTVTVVNGPAPGGREPAERRVEPDSQGLGLVGMRERVSLEGGALETGPTGDGGFRVHAVLPIEDRSTTEEIL